ncbi:MAG: hypothetical protein A4S12_05860 [Proteobacteria bacterium SG_bin5]|nr:cobalamin-binding protein [Sphingomonas sp.]OQW42996.1 MAG: hypothetical protein A4S12_05860 [Proteobacteria bacterium SG_bin5]
MASLFSFGRPFAGLAGRKGAGRAAWRFRADGDPRENRSEPVTAAPSKGSLSAVVEREIIPRLVAAHPRDSQIAPSVKAPAILRGEVESFTSLVLTAEADVLLDYIDALVARGIGAEAVLIDLLAPTARRLGEFWNEDYCDFIDVTMALWRLQEVVHELAARVPIAEAAPAGRRALFAPMPGDQHSFGAVVMDEIFTRDGWLTERLTESTTPELLARLASTPFDLVGLTVSCDCHMRARPALITALRNVACNPRLCVMVGGRVFVDEPERAAEVGADGTAADARQAVALASRLVAARARGALTAA